MSSEDLGRASPPGEKIIVIVDDDHDIGDLLQQIILDQTAYKVVWIAESDLALQAASFLRPSLLLLDYMLPSMNGLFLYDRLQEIETFRGIPTVIISAGSTLPFEEMRSRGMHLLKKPFEIDDLLDLLAELLS